MVNLLGDYALSRLKNHCITIHILYFTWWPKTFLFLF